MIKYEDKEKQRIFEKGRDSVIMQIGNMLTEASAYREDDMETMYRIRKWFYKNRRADENILE